MFLDNQYMEIDIDAANIHKLYKESLEQTLEIVGLVLEKFAKMGKCLELYSNDDNMNNEMIKFNKELGNFKLNIEAELTENVGRKI